MKFYNRTDELAELATMYEQSADGGRMTVLTGRRRVGKTVLALEAAKQHKHIYLFVSKKAETLLCQEHLEEIRRLFSPPVVGDIRHFKDIFLLLIELSRTERITLIIDEFQEFFSINPAVYSELQGIWDRNRSTCKLNVIFIGSVHSLMYRIFQDQKEPLFGRADRIMFLKPFSIRSIHEVTSDFKHPDIQTLFDVYAITGGLPKYLAYNGVRLATLEFDSIKHSHLLFYGSHVPEWEPVSGRSCVRCCLCQSSRFRDAGASLACVPTLERVNDDNFLLPFASS